MAFSWRRGRIEASSALLPPRRVSNSDLTSVRPEAQAGAQADTQASAHAEENRLLRQTGIATRRYALAEEAASDLAAQALEPLLAADVHRLRALIVATTSPDYPSPATASYVHARMGLPANVLAFDVSSSCSSFLSALLAGLGLLDGSGRVAVVASEVKHKSLGGDARLRALFADGAGAVLLTRGDGREGFLPAYARTDAAFAHHIQIPIGGSRTPVTPENAGDARLRMLEPRLVYRHTVKAFCDAIEACWSLRTDACARMGLLPDDVPGLVFTHQANANILREVRERIAPEIARRIPILMEDVGNMVCASLPVARTRVRLLERLWTPERFRDTACVDGFVADAREDAESLFVRDRSGAFFLDSLSTGVRVDLHDCLRAGLLPLSPARPSRPRVDLWVCAGGGFQTIGLLHGRGFPVPLREGGEGAW